MFVICRPPGLTPSNRYEKGSELSGVIYLHRISDNRFGGIAGRNFDIFHKLCGDAASGNVVFVTNMWGEVSRNIGEARERELSDKFFKPVLEKGAQMVRHHDTVQSAHDVIRRIAGNRPVVLRIQQELVDERRDIANTAAGEAVNRELNEQMRRHQAQLKAVQEEMEQAMEENDEETRQELEEERRKLQEQVEKTKNDSEGMVSRYAAEKERMEARMEKMEQEAEEREQAEVEYHLQPTDLNHSLQGAINLPAVGQPILEQEVESPQNLLKDSDDNGLVTIPIYK